MDLARALECLGPVPLVGVDGGASGFRAHRVCVVPGGRGRDGPRLATQGLPSRRSIEPVPGFQALPLDRQSGPEAGEAPGALERELRERWLEAACGAILGLGLDPARGARPLIGLCAPGLKTADGRGIRAALHGPRIPDFAAELERRLAQAGLVPARPLGPLAADGLAAGTGEWLGALGRLSGLQQGYYLGGGSGVAECLLLDGLPRAPEGAGLGLDRAWEALACDGRSYEVHLSAAGLNRDWSALGTGLPEAAAAAGNRRAVELFRERTLRLADWCLGRLSLVHHRAGRVLERIVVGQRLGGLFLDPALAAHFARPARERLAERIAVQGPRAVAEVWLRDGALAPERLVGSDLREAPAIGALALALEGP